MRVVQVPIAMSARGRRLYFPWPLCGKCGEKVYCHSLENRQLASFVLIFSTIQLI